MVEHVALIGLPGAGKSLVASLLARSLGWASVDLDEAVERREGRSVAELFAAHGEPGFRARESRALAEVLERSTPVVLACGGGVLTRPFNRELLKRRTRIVWLEVEPQEAAARLGPEGFRKRPLLSGAGGPARLRDLLEVRAAGYAAAAHLRVKTDGLTAAEVVARVRALLEGADA